jgi:hypothetical protein
MEDNEAITFGMDRIRLITKAKLNSKMSFKLQVDFVKVAKDVDADGDSPGIIKDAVLGIKMLGGHQLFLGKQKTPAGYEFNFSGTKLDVVKRGFGHQTMIFERNMGMLLKTPKYGPMKIYAKAGLFNAGPKKANDTGDAAEGQDYTFSSAFYATPVKNLTTHLSYSSAGTSVDGQEAVSLMGLAVDYKTDKFRGVVEQLTRDDADHSGSDGSTLYAMLGYKVKPGLEFVVRSESLDVEDDSKDRADIVGGVNLYFTPDKPWTSKVMLNYVSSDMDGKSGVQLMFQGVF